MFRCRRYVLECLRVRVHWREHYAVTNAQQDPKKYLYTNACAHIHTDACKYADTHAYTYTNRKLQLTPKHTCIHIQTYTHTKSLVCVLSKQALYNY